MPETRNIVILGASFAGLSAAHYLARHTLPKLQQNKDVQYVLHLVDPSTHFWWHIAAPRELVSVKAMPHDKTFVPIMDGFKQYKSLEGSIVFHHRHATALDTDARTVTLEPHGDANAAAQAETLAYYALVIATGVRSPTACTTLHGDYTLSQQALESMNAQLSAATDVIIGGGGAVGVETAGEMATTLHGKTKITLVAGGSKLLPALSAKRAAKAQAQLEKLGVIVRYGAKVTSTSTLPDGKTQVVLDDGTTLATDVYFPAVGVQPNTAFLPAALRATTGYVAADKHTLRVPAAGERVYAAGDVAGADSGGVLNLYKSLPVMAGNLSRDLLGAANAGPERRYEFKASETQVVPVGPKTGVGAFNGFGMPGFVVAMAKGKDYLLSNMSGITEGSQWKKA
nr:apoptosis-inducing factor 2 [Quercus suber]